MMTDAKTGKHVPYRHVCEVHGCEHDVVVIVTTPEGKTGWCLAHGAKVMELIERLTKQEGKGNGN